MNADLPLITNISSLISRENTVFTRSFNYTHSIPFASYCRSSTVWFFHGWRLINPPSLHLPSPFFSLPSSRGERKAREISINYENPFRADTGPTCPPVYSDNIRLIATRTVTANRFTPLGIIITRATVSVSLAFRFVHATMWGRKKEANDTFTHPCGIIWEELGRFPTGMNVLEHFGPIKEAVCLFKRDIQFARLFEKIVKKKGERKEKYRFQSKCIWREGGGDCMVHGKSSLFNHRVGGYFLFGSFGN